MILVVAVIGVLIWVSRPDLYRPQADFGHNGGNGRPVDGVRCSTRESLDFHVHAHLDVIKDGKKVKVPSDIGVPGGCLYWLHTHDESAVIHVESPVRRAYALGEFFDVWGAPLSKARVLSFETSPSEPLRVYVNGKLRGGDPRGVPIKGHEEIALVIGGMKGKPPASYDFPPGE